MTPRDEPADVVKRRPLDDPVLFFWLLFVSFAMLRLLAAVRDVSTNLDGLDVRLLRVEHPELLGNKWSTQADAGAGPQAESE